MKDRGRISLCCSDGNATACPKRIVDKIQNTADDRCTARIAVRPNQVFRSNGVESPINHKCERRLLAVGELPGKNQWACSIGNNAERAVHCAGVRHESRSRETSNRLGRAVHVHNTIDEQRPGSECAISGNLESLRDRLTVIPLPAPEMRLNPVLPVRISLPPGMVDAMISVPGPPATATRDGDGRIIRVNCRNCIVSKANAKWCGINISRGEFQRAAAARLCRRRRNSQYHQKLRPSSRRQCP